MAEEKLSDVFYQPKTIQIGRWNVPLRRLTLADWAAMETEFGSIDKFMEAFAGGNVFNATLWLLWRMVKKVDPLATKEEVGEAIEDLQQAIEWVNHILEISVPEAWRPKEGGGNQIGGS